MLAKAGYAEVQGLEPMFDNDAKTVDLKALLDSNGLAMPVAHCQLATLEKDPDLLLRCADTLGIKHFFVAYLVPEARPAEPEGWTQYGARLTAAGAPLRDAGLGFGWHNHDFEFVPLADGTLALDRIFAAQPKLNWEIDVAWIVRSGADPLAWIAKYGARITTVHIKDIAEQGANTDEDGWADPGTGTIDWPAMLAALKEHTQVQHYVMEHDKPSDDQRFAINAITNCHKMMTV